MRTRKRQLLSATEAFTGEAYTRLYRVCFLQAYHPTMTTISKSCKADNILHIHVTRNYPYSTEVVMHVLQKRRDQKATSSHHLSAVQLIADLIVVGVLCGVETLSVGELIYSHSIPAFVSTFNWASALMKRQELRNKLDVLDQSLDSKELLSLFRHQEWVFDHVCTKILHQFDYRNTRMS